MVRMLVNNEFDNPEPVFRFLLTKDEDIGDYPGDVNLSVQYKDPETGELRERLLLWFSYYEDSEKIHLVRSTLIGRTAALDPYFVTDEQGHVCDLS